MVRVRARARLGRGARVGRRRASPGVAGGDIFAKLRGSHGGVSGRGRGVRGRRARREWFPPRRGTHRGRRDRRHRPRDGETPRVSRFIVATEIRRRGNRERRDSRESRSGRVRVRVRRASRGRDRRGRRARDSNPRPEPPRTARAPLARSRVSGATPDVSNSRRRARSASPAATRRSTPTPSRTSPRSSSNPSTPRARA